MYVASIINCSSILILYISDVASDDTRNRGVLIGVPLTVNYVDCTDCLNNVYFDTILFKQEI